MAGWAEWYYRGKLKPHEQKLYDCIYDGWSKGKGQISVPPLLGQNDSTEQIVSAVAMDHPEVFWVDYYEYNCQSVGIPGRMMLRQLDFQLFSSPSEIRRHQKMAMDWRNRVLRQIPSGTNGFTVAWMLFDYLSRQVTYGERGNAQSHTIIGCFLPRNHISVCEGIAKGFKFLCDGIGLHCIVVSGEAGSIASGGREGHAWNMVEVNGIYRHLDITAELMLSKRQGNARLKEYHYTDSELSGRGYIWDRSLVPACR